MLAGFGLVSHASAQSYQITAINPLSGDETSIAMGINNAGTIAGTSFDANGDSHAFMLQGSTQSALTTLGGTSSEANSISNTGQIGGSSALSSGLTHACCWISGTPTDVDPTNVYGPSRGSAINSLGALAGYYQTSQNLPQGFIYNSAGITAIDYPAATETQVIGLNDAGAVVGTFTGASAVNAFVQNGSTYQLLPNASGGSSGQANAVNLGGIEAGWVTNSSNDEQAAIWQNGTLTLIGDLGGGYGEATSINDFGQVVGASNIAASVYNYASSQYYTPTNNGLESAGSVAALNDSLSHAFIYQKGTMTDLNTYLPQKSDWTLQRATGINDAGQIAGYGVLNGVLTGFLLTPITTPVSGAGTLSLTANSYNINKNDGTVTIAVTRTGGTTGAVSALVGVTSGTALAGTNFSPTFVTVTFAAGQSGSQTVTIPIIDDPSIVTNESFSAQIFQITGGAAKGSTSVATVNIVAPPFDTWRGKNFTSAQLANTAISGPLATPANDGISNLLKYALGLNPLAPASNIVTVVPDPTQTYLELTYTSVNSATDVSLAVEVAPDLVHWSSGSSVTTVTQTVNNGSTQTVTVKSNTPISAAPSQFMQLQVTRLP